MGIAPLTPAPASLDQLDFEPPAPHGALYFKAAGGWASLSPGAAGEFLQTVGVGGDPLWVAVPGGGDMLAATYDPLGVAADAFNFANMEIPASAQGDLIVRGAGAWQRLVGTSSPGRVLTNSGAGLLFWGNPAGDMLAATYDPLGVAADAFNFANMEIASEAQGDVLYHGGAGWLRLPAGAAGEVLVSGGPAANPAWGAGAIPTAATVWVAKDGNDGTGTPYSQDLPYLTVGAALAAASTGDLVRVRPGIYTESGLTIPAGVVLDGGSWLTTAIGSAAAVADIIALGAGSGVREITVIVPTAAFAGIKHIAGTASVFGLNILGDGAAGGGFGIFKSGAGKLIGSARCERGGLAACFHVDSGVLALDDVHCPQSAGAIGAVVLAGGAGLFQCQGINIGNTGVVDAVQVGGTATIRIYSPNIFDVANALHATANGVSAVISGGKISASLRSVWVDPALTGVGMTVRISGCVLDPLFDFPPAAAGNADFALSFNQAEAQTRDSRQRLIGADLALGFPELGSGFEVGRGAPYSDGIHVATTDGSETMVGSVVTGGNQTDVTVAAASRSGSTFSFQGLTAGHAIYIASKRTTPAGVQLKHWGWVLDQTAAGVGGAYVVEVWDGAAWVAVGTMAVSAGEQYVYADQLFLRAGSQEDVHLGIDDLTTQALSTVLGHVAYHTRIRVVSLLTTAPTWERLRIMESSRGVNALGQMSARGLSMWRAELYGVGNVWGEIAGAADANIAVGTGALPTGWTQKLKKGLLNGAGDGAAWQGQIPAGLCTAFPITMTLTYSLVGGAPITVAPEIVVSLLRLAAGGVLIADSGGAPVPVARAATAAETFTSKAADSVIGLAPLGVVQDRPLTLNYGPFDIADYYAGDSLILAIEMDVDGTPAQDVVLWSLTLSGVKFTEGTRL